MKHTITRAAIIGSGTMGSGIASHFANAGFDVILLDIPSPEGKNKIVDKAIANMHDKSAHFFTNPGNIERIITGNLTDDLHRLAKADWIIEVIVEDLNLKHELYEKISEFCSDTAIISSNTSTFTLRVLTQNLPTEVRERFFITHFFNPPRYLPLLELVIPPNVSPILKDTLTKFCEDQLGRTVVVCNDTPGFIANRIGCAWLAFFLYETEVRNSSIGAMDKLVSKVMSVPKTGVFGLIDLIGVDVFSLIMHSLTNALPENDPLFTIKKPSSTIERLLANKHLGRKTRVGFYKRDGSTESELELKSGRYIELGDVRQTDVMQVMHSTDNLSTALRISLVKTLIYACHVMPETASDVSMVDTAMRSGYNWKFGPFQLIDNLSKILGDGWLAIEAQKLQIPVPALLQMVGNKSFYQEYIRCIGANGKYVPISFDTLRYDLTYLRSTGALIIHNDSANLFDIGDNVVCFELANKNRTIDRELLTLLEQSLKYVAQKRLTGMVVCGGDNFCLGADIRVFSNKIAANNYEYIAEIINYGTKVFNAVKYATFPVVAAVSGMALGGGCELIMHCRKAVAHCNARIGLVEAGIGLIPGWGGCREILYRVSKDNIADTFHNILEARTSSSAEEAKELLYLSENDEIIMGQAALIPRAKECVLYMARSGYKTRQEMMFSKGIEAYVDILESHLAHNKYATPIEQVGQCMINLYKNMDSFEECQENIFVKLIKTDYAQQKIASITS